MSALLRGNMCVRVCEWQKCMSRHNQRPAAIASKVSDIACSWFRRPHMNPINLWALSTTYLQVGGEPGKTLSNYDCKVPVRRNPSCPQTTLASVFPQRSSHTVPHALLWQTSTRPWLEFAPPTSLTSPLTHPVIHSHGSLVINECMNVLCFYGSRLIEITSAITLLVQWRLTLWWPSTRCIGCAELFHFRGILVVD